MLSTLLLSFGLPLLLGGDEIGRSQGGNNNAYCQDNEISWFDWQAADGELRGYVKRLLALRRAHPAFRRQRFLTGAEAADLGWYCSDGSAVTDEQWADPTMHALGIYLDGTDAPDSGADGTPLLDDDFLILVNAWWEPVMFTIPAGPRGHPDLVHRAGQLRPRRLPRPRVPPAHRRSGSGPSALAVRPARPEAR